METKKNFFNYIKNSYSNTTNFSNFKILRVFYCLALLLTLLFIPTVNAQALELPPGFSYTAPDLPFDLIEDKYYVIIGKGVTGYEELYVSDTPFFMVRGDDKTQINDVNGNVFMWSKMYLSVEDGKYNLNYDRYEYKNNEWILGKKATENLGNQIDIVCFYDYYLYGGAEYLTNHDINGNFNFDGTDIGFFKNDEWVQYPEEEKPEDTLYYDTTLPPEVLKDFYNDYADYMKYYPNFIVRKIKYFDYEFYIATFFNPKNLYIKPGDGNDRREEDKLYWSSIEHDWSNDFIHLTYMPEDDIYDFYYMPDAYDFPYEELTSTKEYFTDFDFIYNGEVVLKKNNIPIEPPVEEPPVEEPPVEETPTVGNESYIIINGEKVSVNYAIVQYLMRIEFIITLLFTVTVVFFIINKFWAWCRRLFTTSIH